MCGECTGAAPQQAYRELLNVNPGNNNPSSLFAHVREKVEETAAKHSSMFGSAGRSGTWGEAAAR